MELWLFLALVVIVLAYLARGRFGRVSDSASRRAREGEPINYGSRVAPPGTSQGAGVNAPWFGRDHTRGPDGGSAAE